MNILSDQQIMQIPKVEFHRHLDGSVRLETIDKINKKNNLQIQYTDLQQLSQKAYIHRPLESLTDFLEALKITQQSLCNYEAIEQICFENVEDSFHDGVKLIELRFAPLYIMEHKNLQHDEVIEAVIDGFERGLKKYKIHGCLIYIQPRGFSEQAIEQDFNMLQSFLNKHGKYSKYIKGFDVADEETIERIQKFLPIIKKVKKAGLKITIHSGEDTSHAMIDETINLYSPHRIGHGIRAVESKLTMEKLKEENICLELCVHSNYLTKANPIKENHPIKTFKEFNVPFNISTDDPHILQTNLVKEYQFLNQTFNFSAQEFFQNNIKNLEYSFLDKDEIKFITKNYFQ